MCGYPPEELSRIPGPKAGFTKVGYITPQKFNSLPLKNDGVGRRPGLLLVPFVSFQGFLVLNFQEVVPWRLCFASVDVWNITTSLLHEISWQVFDRTVSARVPQFLRWRFWFLVAKVIPPKSNGWNLKKCPFWKRKTPLPLQGHEFLGLLPFPWQIKIYRNPLLLKM